MSTLINCEFIKMKHSLSTFLLFGLALIPIIINMSRPLLIKQKYSLFDLYFPMYNQYTLFFPLVVILLAASIFYIEYSNGTYVDWITYGYSKRQLIISKLAVATILLTVMCLINYLVMSVGLLLIIHGTIAQFLRISISFWLYSVLTIMINLPFGALIINISRNAITTSIIGIICMILDAILMVAPFGYCIPTIFAYRLGMLPLSKSYFFENVTSSLQIGLTVAATVIFLLTSMAILQFSQRKRIES